MKFRGRFLYRLLFLVGLLLTASCSQEQIAAEIIHASTTTPDRTAAGLIPAEINCGGKTIGINGGTVQWTIVGQTADDVTFDAVFDLGLPVPTNREADSEYYKLECTIRLRYAGNFDGTALNLTGTATVPTCENFDCKYKKDALNCEKMKEALANVCQ